MTVALTERYTHLWRGAQTGAPATKGPMAHHAPAASAHHHQTPAAAEMPLGHPWERYGREGSEGPT